MISKDFYGKLNLLSKFENLIISGDWPSFDIFCFAYLRHSKSIINQFPVFELNYLLLHCKVCIEKNFKNKYSSLYNFKTNLASDLSSLVFQALQIKINTKIHRKILLFAAMPIYFLPCFYTCVLLKNGLKNSE